MVQPVLNLGIQHKGGCAEGGLVPNHPRDHENHHRNHQNHLQGLAPLTASPPYVGSQGAEISKWRFSDMRRCALGGFRPVEFESEVKN